ncbi:hypothetical protein JHK86_024835 [Glycine max]|nr:hypothetical protein JHK86_024835 [Glycine max]
MGDQATTNTNATGNTVFSIPTSQPQVEDCSVFDDHENLVEYHVLGLEQTPLPLGSDVSGLGRSCSVPLSNEATWNLRLGCATKSFEVMRVLFQSRDYNAAPTTTVFTKAMSSK